MNAEQLTKAKSLGFSPEIPLDRGVSEVVAWYRENRGRTDTRYDVFSRGDG